MHFIVDGDWKPVLHDVVDILFGRVKELSDVFIALLLMVLIVFPGFGCFAIPLKHHEIGIEQENDVILHLLLVELHCFRLSALPVERVGQQHGLDHR